MDIDIVFKIASIGIAVAILSIVLEKAQRKEIAQITSLAGLIIALFMVIRLISELFNEVKEVFYLQ